MNVKCRKVFAEVCQELIKLALPCEIIGVLHAPAEASSDF